jgi:ribosomal protein L40E
LNVNFIVLAASSTKIAWVHAKYLATLSDELTHLKTLDQSRYSYDEFNEDNIGNLWVNIDDYKAILIDEDCMYSWSDGSRLEIHYSFYDHRTQLDQWVSNGGGLFSTCNNDQYNAWNTAYKLVWDWLPDSLVVSSYDVGTNAAHGHLKIVDRTHWLFTTPNKLDDTYINDQSRGHAHGYFVISECPGYSTLMVRTDTGYENEPVEIVKNYGLGVVVVSHAELEDGSSWEYVQNEIDNVLLSPRDQLVSSLNMLNRTICELITEDTREAAKMRADSLTVLDPDNKWLAFDMIKLMLSILLSAKTDYSHFQSLTSGEVESLTLTEEYLKGTATGLGWADNGFSGWWTAQSTFLKPDDNYDWNLVFRDKEAFSISSETGKIDHYYEILMGQKNDGTQIWPCHGISAEKEHFYGVAGILSQTVRDYNSFVASIPSTLPSNFDLTYALTYLNNLRNSLRPALQQQTSVNYYDATRKGGALMELGGLHALEKPLEFAIDRFLESEALNTAMWAVSFGVGLAKLAMVIPTIGLGSAALNVIVAAGSIAVDKMTTEMALQAKTLLVLTLIRSIAVLDTETVLCRKILGETTNFVNGLIAATSIVAPSIKITKVSIPDVSTQTTFGIGSGDIEVQNTGSSDATVTLFVMFYAPTQKTNIWLQMVDAGLVQKGSKATAHLTFDVPKTAFFGCEQFYADVRAYATSDLGIALTDHYSPTPSFYVGDSCGVTVKDIATQSLSQGETKSYEFTTTSKSARFMVWYKGSRIDLHLYDTYGHHVGVNYQTGGVDNEIPDAQYSGPDQNPEWIYIPNAANLTYTLRVVGVDLSQPENFTITSTEIPVQPALMTQIPSEVRDECFPGETVDLPITFVEYGGQNGFANVRFEASSLKNFQGDTISQGNISLNPTSFGLNAGSSVTAKLSINVPADVRNGVFSGELNITSSGSPKLIPVELNVLGYYLNLSCSPAGSGMISINDTAYVPPTNCSYAGSWTINATALQGYTFDHWAVGPNVTIADPNSQTTTVSIRGPGFVQAIFVGPSFPFSPILWAAVVCLVFASGIVGTLYSRSRRKLKSIANKPATTANVCPNCGTTNALGARFCKKCGKLLPH